MGCPDIIQTKTKMRDSEWVYDLLEKIFNENNPSTEGVKGHGMSQANPGPNQDRRF